MHSTSNISKKINSRVVSFQHDIRLDVTPLNRVKIEYVRFEHKRKEEKDITIDYLYLKGNIKNTTLPRRISNIFANADFLDENGDIVASVSKKVTPTIIKLNGYFTIQIPYDSSISLCKLEIVKQ